MIENLDFMHLCIIREALVEKLATSDNFKIRELIKYFDNKIESIMLLANECDNLYTQLRKD